MLHSHSVDSVRGVCVASVLPKVDDSCQHTVASLILERDSVGIRMSIVVYSSFSVFLDLSQRVQTEYTTASEEGIKGMLTNV